MSTLGCRSVCIGTPCSRDGMLVFHDIYITYIAIAIQSSIFLVGTLQYYDYAYLPVTVV